MHVPDSQTLSAYLIVCTSGHICLQTSVSWIVTAPVDSVITGNMKSALFPSLPTEQCQLALARRDTVIVTAPVDSVTTRNMKSAGFPSLPTVARVNP